MGTRMAVGRNKNLYEFWRKKVTQALNEELDEDEVFVNLASNEYFKAIDLKDLKVPVITPVFKDLKNGEYKMIMTFAKLARGYMTRYLIDNNATTIDDIKGFNYEGYGFSESLSTDTRIGFYSLVFHHTHPYEPFIPENATKLIVGTLPPPRFTTGELKEGDVNFCYGSRDGQLMAYS